MNTKSIFFSNLTSMHFSSSHKLDSATSGSIRETDPIARKLVSQSALKS